MKAEEGDKETQHDTAGDRAQHTLFVSPIEATYPTSSPRQPHPLSLCHWLSPLVLPAGEKENVRRQICQLNEEKAANT